MRLIARGFEKKIADLTAMNERLRNPQPALEVGAQRLVKFFSDRFRSQTDPSGNAWAPLAASTIAGRRKGRGSGGVRILQDTRVYANSITATAGPKSISFGTNVPYAGYHQSGTRVMPRRAVFPVEPDGRTATDTGPAKELWDRLMRYLESYVKTGTIAG